MIDRISILLRTTAFRLVSIYLALLMLAGTIAAIALISQTSSILTADALREIAEERAELIELTRARGHRELAAVVDGRSRSGRSALYHLTDAGGMRRAGNLATMPAQIGADGGIFRYPTPRGERLAAGVRIGLPGGGELAIARDIEAPRLVAERLRGMFLWSFAALMLAGATGGAFISRYLLQRIGQMTAASRSIMAGDLARRIPLSGSGDELDGLAASLNAMLERIEQLMAGMREVSDNIAHDLKTPLNRMRNRIETALRPGGSPAAHRAGLEQALEEADEIIKTFNALLLIARLEAGAVEASKERLDIVALLDGIKDLYEPVAESAGLEMTVTSDDGLSIRGNRQLVGQAIANLVDNAIKYAARGDAAAHRAGRLEVRARAVAAGVEIVVADNGEGIPEHERERALRRFVRLDKSRSKPGTGLGLSLVAAVARLHGGSIRLEDNGPGLRAVLQLPDEAGTRPRAGEH